MDAFPELSTARLRLRELTEDDAPTYRALLHLPEVTRFTNLVVAPDEATAQKTVRNMMEIFGDGCGGIGYEAHPDFWGQGLMSEAVRAVVQCGHGRFDLNRIEAWTVPGNGGSDRVLEKAGFRLEGVQRQKGYFHDVFHDTRLFGRLASDPL